MRIINLSLIILFEIAARTTLCFFILHEVLAPTSRKKMKNADGVAVSVKRSIDDSISSFFVSVPTPQKWDEYQKSSVRTSQPVIGLIGPDWLNPTSICIIFDDIKYFNNFNILSSFKLLNHIIYSS